MLNLTITQFMIRVLFIYRCPDWYWETGGRQYRIGIDTIYLCGYPIVSRGVIPINKNQSSNISAYKALNETLYQSSRPHLRYLKNNKVGMSCFLCLPKAIKKRVFLESLSGPRLNMSPGILFRSRFVLEGHNRGWKPSGLSLFRFPLLKNLSHNI